MKNKKLRQAKKTLHAVASAKPIARLLKAKRAISPVISNLILIAAVIVVGFSVLAYAQSQSTNYVTQYGQSVNSDINQLSETVAFEYVYYNSSSMNLTIYFMNAGFINNVNITSVSLKSNSAANSLWSSPIPVTKMYSLNNNTVVTALNEGDAGYIVLPTISLTAGQPYTIKMTTWRGSTFEYNFVA